MAAGGVLCLVTVVVSCKVGEGNRCSADGAAPVVPVVPLPPEEGTPLPPISEKKPMSPATETLPEPKPETIPPPADLPVPEKPDDKPGAAVKPPTVVRPPTESMPPADVTPPGSPAEAATSPPVPRFTVPMLTVPSVPASPPTVQVQAPALPAEPVAAPPAAPMPRDPSEPPLAPQPGPVVLYHVPQGGETLQDIARRTLASGERWIELVRFNPALAHDSKLTAGTLVRLPADACVPTEDLDAVKPLPGLKPLKTEPKAKVALPLTGTFPCNLDDQHALVLPKAIRDQLGSAEMVMVSPGTDQCLWLTTPTYLERLAQRMEQSQAKEVDVHAFKRLYFAQTEKVTLGAEGRVVISDRLTQFAGLHQEVVLVGIDDHFELWDVSRWKDFTQKKSAAARANIAAEQE
jgi:MraZ protein